MVGDRDEFEKERSVHGAAGAYRERRKVSMVQQVRMGKEEGEGGRGIR